MQELKTTYHSPSGQSLRQMQESGDNHIVILKKETDLVEVHQCHGARNFTREMWSTDVDDIITWSKEWSCSPKKLTFEVRDL